MGWLQYVWGGVVCVGMRLAKWLGGVAEPNQSGMVCVGMLKKG